VHSDWGEDTEVFLNGVTRTVSLSRVGSVTFKKYFNYKIQNTFLKSNSNTFLNYFFYEGQNTKYELHFGK